MDYTTAMDGHPVSLAEGRAELAAHGAETAIGPSGELLALEVYTQRGRTYTGWTVLPLDSAAILRWLGY